ncbi:hypothetical protein Agub_g1659, partial [Astrephomene gubernaculifera]
LGAAAGEDGAREGGGCSCVAGGGGDGGRRSLGAGGGGGGCSEGAGAVRRLVLVGFSKGAVVLNQLLTEMAWREETLFPAAAPQAAAQHHQQQGPATGPHGAQQQQPTRTLGAAPGTDAAGTPSTPVAATLAASPTTSLAAGAVAAAAPALVAAVPTAAASTAPLACCSSSSPPPPPAGNPAAAAAVAALLDSVSAVHFLDAGLNCRGVHLTDPAVVSQLGRRHTRVPLAVHLHGTPRQWGDRRRPWVVSERDRFLALLRGAGVPCSLQHYFQGQPASLRQHFDVIAHMRLPGAVGGDETGEAGLQGGSDAAAPGSVLMREMRDAGM